MCWPRLSPSACAPRRCRSTPQVQPRVVLLIFVSGKVVLTGGKVRNEIYSAFEKIYPVLEEFRKAVESSAT